MTLKKAIEVLSIYQAWRIGEEDVDIQKPSVVTEAINTLLDYHIGDNNEMVSTQTEISDDQIFKQSIKKMEEWYGSDCKEEIDAHFRGAKWMQKWYKEQLKKINDKTNG